MPQAFKLKVSSSCCRLCILSTVYHRSPFAVRQVKLACQVNFQKDELSDKLHWLQSWKCLWVPRWHQKGIAE